MILTVRCACLFTECCLSFPALQMFFTHKEDLEGNYCNFSVLTNPRLNKKGQTNILYFLFSVSQSLNVFGGLDSHIKETFMPLRYNIRRLAKIIPV